MRVSTRILALALAATFLLNFTIPGLACGPSAIAPVFVFKQSPDLPFAEFTKGKIGIIRPTFGRKTLVIAYRYLNGGSFDSDEQEGLVQALKGEAPEAGGDSALKAWINARKEFLKEDQQLPKIYTERRYGGYDFFPNCTKNAFEVATQTLRDRVASYGADDVNVHAWIEAQDTVFQNCSGGAQVPPAVGASSPSWLAKDRDYQIAAAHFYSLQFDEARSRFERIAADADSIWQQTAAYLVARTLVRQASLAEPEIRKREFYEQAETRLQTLIETGGKFADASEKLLALVKYHLHPEERVAELGRTLVGGSDANIRQDLIDYVWLLDKFESQILKAEEERKKKLEAIAAQPETALYLPDKEAIDWHQRIQRGELIEIRIFLKKPDGSEDYDRSFERYLKYDATDAEILGAFEEKFGRPLTTDEIKEIREKAELALTERQRLLSPNRKWEDRALAQHEGCDGYQCDKLTLALIPDFFRSDDLTDWIFTVQTQDPAAYNHALSKWRETDSPVWLITALIRAEKNSPGLAELMRAAEKSDHNATAFPTVAYHLVRLKIAMGKVDEARKLLEETISKEFDVLPTSAQNQFLEQRMRLASDLNEFLKSAQRKPAAFSLEGTPGRISDILALEKTYWYPEYSKQSKEEYEQEVDVKYKDLLEWEDRFTFDDKTVDIFDWNFPLQTLVEIARSPAVPDYLKRRLVLAAWTRAVLLKNVDVELKIAPDVLKVAPEITSVFRPYIEARTTEEQHYAALFVLLKFPGLSPLVDSGVPTFSSSEEKDYYFETAWWCAPSDTDYDEEGKEVAKQIARPDFLTSDQLAVARREHLALVAIGNAKSYLGKQAIEWAKKAPEDPRIPEALLVAARANENYKYGCGGWESDDVIRLEAETILRRHYPRSPWTAKLTERDK
jgi:hypothetical protein